MFYLICRNSKTYTVYIYNYVILILRENIHGIYKYVVPCTHARTHGRSSLHACMTMDYLYTNSLLFISTNLDPQFPFAH
jgi:hypothetical protein